MPFRVEVRPAWNIGHGEPNDDQWAPAMDPDGTPNEAACTFDSVDAANGFEASVKFQIASGFASMRDRETRVLPVP